MMKKHRLPAAVLALARAGYNVAFTYLYPGHL